MAARIVFLCILTAFVWGCAGKAAPGREEPVRDAVREAGSDLKASLRALDDKDEAAAGQALARAVRRLGEADDSARRIMAEATDRIGEVVQMSGFEYASRQAHSLLVVYLEMHRAYTDRDDALLASLYQKFHPLYQETIRATLAEKQRRLEELGSEIASRKEEIKKTTEPSVLENYPVVYVVKKGDTLPAIAARHDIYNDSFMWPVIYKANRDQIKDPKVLYTGQNLRIPRDMSMEEIVEARREAGAPDPEKIPKDAYVPKKRR